MKHVVGRARKSPFAATALLAALLGFVPLAAADPTDEDPGGPSADPAVVAGKKAIDDKRWADAIKSLSSAALRDTRNADIQNYLGYAYRNAGQMDKAFAHYERALKLNPRHRGAHEYVGEAYLMVGNPAQAVMLLQAAPAQLGAEAYLMVGNPAQAREHLKALQTICLLPCEEFDDLKMKIDRYQRDTRKP